MRTNRSTWTLGIFLAAAMVCSACSSTSTPSKGLPTCTDPFSSYAAPALIGPASGATGVSPAVGTLYLEGEDFSGNFTLVAGSKTLPLPAPAAAATPLPSGAPTQSPAGGPIETIAIPPLASNTTYALVTTIDYTLDFCTAVRRYTVGTFTTS